VTDPAGRRSRGTDRARVETEPLEVREHVEAPDGKSATIHRNPGLTRSQLFITRWARRPTFSSDDRVPVPMQALQALPIDALDRLFVRPVATRVVRAGARGRRFRASSGPAARCQSDDDSGDVRSPADFRGHITDRHRITRIKHDPMAFGGARQHVTGESRDAVEARGDEEISVGFGR
jgi:hypothetical protein